MSDLAVRKSAISGLLLIDLPVHGDNRGWFKENWQREKMVAAGLPDFAPVQNNVSFNAARGTTRGIHAEPWDKFVSVATGRVFGAWVDLREGPGFGSVVTAEVGPDTAVFVPRGVANAFQTLEDDTAYSYLVNAHWSPDARYTFLNLADETVAIDWPIPLERAETSQKDRDHPRLADVTPVAPRRTVVLGAGGQLGRALTRLLPDALALSSREFDVSDPTAYASVDWSDVDTIVNAAAYTKVDEAETDQGRRDAWRVNAHAATLLARTAVEHGLTLVHVSTDYVFDGTETEHSTDEPFSPLGVYGASKAAGDVAVAVVPRHYVVRTSWVIGDGPNFIRTMRSLADRDVEPTVVDDQIGRLTYADDLAAGIVALLRERRPYGTYNVTSGGAPRSWFEIAREVYAEAGKDPAMVSPVSTEEYGAGKSLAPRPRHSTLRAD